MPTRDEHGIICQNQIVSDSPTTPAIWKLDGGDSACRTGLMAMCGSEEDALQLYRFIYKAKLERHPFQLEYVGRTELVSRDQLEPFVAGLYETGQELFARLLFSSYAKRFFTINTDILWFDSFWHLVLCCRFKWDKLWRFIGAPFYFVSVLWHCWVRPWSEQNQAIARFYVAGPRYLKLYTKLHPDWQKAVRTYWQAKSRLGNSDIGEALINKVFRVLTTKRVERHP